MCHKIAVFSFILIITLSTIVFGQADMPFSMLDPGKYDPAVDPDPNMFIGNWRDSMPRNIHGSLVVRDILTELEGEDHLRPTRKAAVLRKITSVSYATLEPRASTSPFINEGEQELYYINSGSGTVSSDGETYSLREGNGILIAPGIEYTMTADAGEHLTMYRIVEPIPEGFEPNENLVVTDEYENSQGMSVHWVNIDRGIIGGRDGCAVIGGLTAVKLDPMTMAQPHSHQDGVEEIWIALKGDITLLFGKHLFKLPVGAAYKVPENSMCAHSNINSSDTQVKLMHMMHVPENAMRRLR